MPKFQDIFEGMFVNLTDYEYARTRKEAVGFYLVHMLILLVSALVIGMLMYASSVGNDSERILIRILGTLYCTSMAVYVVLRKRMWSWHGWVLVVLTCVGAFLTSLLGMAVLAYLTTKPMWWPVGEPETVPEPVPAVKPAPEKGLSQPKPETSIVKRKKAAMPPPQPRPKTERINPNLIKEESDKTKS